MSKSNVVFTDTEGYKPTEELIFDRGFVKAANKAVKKDRKKQAHRERDAKSRRQRADKNWY